MAAEPTRMTEAQRAYEARRAAKAGLSLEKWLALKERERREEERARAPAPEAKPAKPPGLVSRWLERARRPLR